MLIWLVFVVTLIVVFGEMILQQYWVDPEIGVSWFSLSAVVFVLFHATRTLGKKGTIIFLAISIVLSLSAELLGVAYGWFFGNYYYPSGSSSLLDWKILGLVPFSILISWTTILYLAYAVSRLIMLNLSLPTNQARIRYNIFRITFASIIAGAIALSLDLLIDPLAVMAGWWIWSSGGVYYGVPLSNFAGWFFVSFSIMFLFGIVKYSISDFGHVEIHSKLQWIDYLPSVMLMLYAARYLILAQELNHLELILIGAIALFPFMLLATKSFITYRAKTC